MKLIIVIYVILNYIISSNALRCYTCTVSEGDVDQRCVTDPGKVEAGSPITNCNKNYCTSMRVEYLDPKDTVQSMYRSCEDEPVYMNQVLEDSSNRIYFIACQTDLCNGGTGKDTTTGIIPGVDDGVGVLYVPGIGKSNSIEYHVVSPFLLLFLIKMLFIL